MSQNIDLSKEAQEKMWLDDLKALLDEDAPAAAGPQGANQNRAPYGGPAMQNPGPALRPNGAPYPSYAAPARNSGSGYPGQQGNSYAAAAQRLYNQQPYEQPVWQQSAPAQQQRPAKPAKARKPSVASIVFLSILVILEAAGIGAVAYSWLQWMH